MNKKLIAMLLGTTMLVTACGGGGSGTGVVTPATPADPPAITDPIDPVVPVDPIDPVIPEDPIDPVIPEDPIDPVVPVDPIDPVVPVDPIDPVVPVDPIDPVVPVDPIDTADEYLTSFKDTVINKMVTTEEVLGDIQPAASTEQYTQQAFFIRTTTNATDRRTTTYTIQVNGVEDVPPLDPKDPTFVDTAATPNVSDGPWQAKPVLNPNWVEPEDGVDMWQFNGAWQNDGAEYGGFAQVTNTTEWTPATAPADQETIDQTRVVTTDTAAILQNQIKIAEFVQVGDLDDPAPAQPANLMQTVTVSEATSIDATENQNIANPAYVAPVVEDPADTYIEDVTTGDTMKGGKVSQGTAWDFPIVNGPANEEFVTQTGTQKFGQAQTKVKTTVYTIQINGVEDDPALEPKADLVETITLSPFVSYEPVTQQVANPAYDPNWVDPKGIKQANVIFVEADDTNIGDINNDGDLLDSGTYDLLNDDTIANINVTTNNAPTDVKQAGISFDEISSGVDTNGDGDIFDWGTYDLLYDDTKPIQTITDNAPTDVKTHTIIFTEPNDGVDTNGDGDLFDVGSYDLLYNGEKVIINIADNAPTDVKTTGIEFNEFGAINGITIGDKNGDGDAYDFGTYDQLYNGVPVNFSIKKDLDSKPILAFSPFNESDVGDQNGDGDTLDSGTKTHYVDSTFTYNVEVNIAPITIVNPIAGTYLEGADLTETNRPNKNSTSIHDDWKEIADSNLSKGTKYSKLGVHQLELAHNQGYDGTGVSIFVNGEEDKKRDAAKYTAQAVAPGATIDFEPDNKNSGNNSYTIYTSINNPIGVHLFPVDQFKAVATTLAEDTSTLHVFATRTGIKEQITDDATSSIIAENYGNHNLTELQSKHTLIADPESITGGNYNEAVAAKIAGVGALVKHKYSNLNASQIKDVLLNTAYKGAYKGTAYDPLKHGQGQLQASNALSAVGQFDSGSWTAWGNEVITWENEYHVDTHGELEILSTAAPYVEKVDARRAITSRTYYGTKVVAETRSCNSGTCVGLTNRTIKYDDQYKDVNNNTGAYLFFQTTNPIYSQFAVDTSGYDYALGTTNISNSVTDINNALGSNLGTGTIYNNLDVPGLQAAHNEGWDGTGIGVIINTDSNGSYVKKSAWRTLLATAPGADLAEHTEHNNAIWTDEIPGQKVVLQSYSGSKYNQFTTKIINNTKQDFLNVFPHGTNNGADQVQYATADRSIAVGQSHVNYNLGDNAALNWITADATNVTNSTQKHVQYAAAKVAGVAAIVRHKFKNLNASETKHILLNNANRTFDGYNSNDHGMGRLDAGAALSPVGALN